METRQTETGLYKDLYVREIQVATCPGCGQRRRGSQMRILRARLVSVAFRHLHSLRIRRPLVATVVPTLR